MLKKDTLLPVSINPLYTYAYKKPVGLMAWRINPPSYQKYTLRRGREIMRWPSYPLTTGQIIARNEEWQRRNNMKIGEQIASDIIRNQLNSLISGKKKPVAAIPKF